MLKNAIDNSTHEVNKLRDENLRMRQILDREREEREQEYSRMKNQINELDRRLGEQ